MDINYIIIQAGGLGSRLKHLTFNKPKGIVPVNNQPMIFHLMNKYKNKKFIIIGDYKYDVLQKYLEVFSPADYIVVKANEKGTCAGIKQAIDIIPESNAFMLIWSDLVVGEKFSLDNIHSNTIGLSVKFQCRWSYKDGLFEEKPSMEYGVAGCFIFKDKSYLDDVPKSGELVRWMQSKNMKFDIMHLDDVDEVGTLIAYDSQKKENVCRPFNSIEVKDNKIIKRAITSQGEKIAKYEINWYKELSKLNYSRIPHIYSYSPLSMEKVNGTNIFKVDLSLNQKKIVVKNFVDALNELHSLGSCEVDYFALQENYYQKTIDRINKVRDLIPFANEKEIFINGKQCKNIFMYKDKFKKLVEKYLYGTKFTLIHGDCTFSNSLIDDKLDITFIDPRGYFGDVLLYGDEYYDWAKLYYSINGNYDQFNNKNFILDILDNEVKLSIDSSKYDELTDYYLSLIPNCNVKKIKLLHAIIWLSLSTYAWEDYDSICGAFYNGLYYLDEFLGEEI